MSHGQQSVSHGQQQGRPTGVLLVSIWYVLGGLLLALLGLLTVVLGGAVSDLFPGFGGAVVVVGIISIGLGAIGFAIAYGIWNLTEWGWLGGLVLSGLGTLLGLLGALSLEPVSIGTFLINAAVLWYLFDNQSLFR